MKNSKIVEAKKANVYLIGVIAAMAGLLFGFDTGVISGAQEFLFKTFNVEAEPWLQGWVVSAVPLGALFGAMVSGYFARELGRKSSIRMTALVFLVGTLMASVAVNLVMVAAGRLLMGLGIGISAMVVPMYLGEVSPANVRGKIIFLFQLAITIGLFLAFATNMCFAHWITDSSVNWRWMFAIGILPSILLYVGMAKMPKSPRWLMLKGRKNEAREVMSFLLGKKDVKDAMDEMEESMKHDGGRNFSVLFKKPIIGLVAISFGLFVFQQLSGINAIMYYGPKVFAGVGFGDEAKFMAQLLIGLTNVVATVFGVWVVDKLGRRPLLFVGFMGMIACLSVMVYCLGSEGECAKLALVSTLFYIVFFAISLGGVPYIMMSEVFPLKNRASGMAIASCANWGFNILVSSTFLTLEGLMGGMGNVFMLYAMCTVVGLLFAWRFVPETKGRHLEEIEYNLFVAKRSLRNLGQPIDKNAKGVVLKELKEKFEQAI